MTIRHVINQDYVFELHTQVLRVFNGSLGWLVKFNYLKRKPLVEVLLTFGTFKEKKSKSVQMFPYFPKVILIQCWVR